jgi:lipopolysaccharide/colanic/teichoic acid biosynthesis glycosyltransferase
MKRACDIVLSIIGLILLSPVFLIIAALIKLDSPGPVFYRGIRVGRYGRPFRIYKFRSMLANADQSGVDSTNSTDLRVTRIGRFIRRFKLDEFSQLINVLTGDMSIVGPRPEVQKFVDMYTEEERAILTLRPGITDWSSIRFHNEGEIIEQSGMADPDEAYIQLIRPEKLRLQLIYVREHDLGTDFKIMLATLLTVVATRLGFSPVGVPPAAPAVAPKTAGPPPAGAGNGLGM